MSGNRGPWRSQRRPCGVRPTAGPALAPRPERAAANDRAFDYGVVAEGHMDGEIDTQRDIPWL